MKQYQDKYFKRAKKENYAARSVYKLKEMDKRFGLFKKGQTVLDLGAAPGSWTQYAGERVGPEGHVLAVDIQDTKHTFAANVTFLQADVFSDSPELLAAMEPLAPFDLVISDMAPKTTGIKFADQANSLELCERAFEVAAKRLKRGGHFAVKIFESGETKAYTDSLRPHFEKIKHFKPYSSRSESKEIFIVALGFAGIDG
ncbi:MAG: RlmE family RNA methyltransferase [Pseudodesulfovibrio sp.]|uniref:Ribosomal RNA large subunit methyltransferase E n=1 Tax=Pseudodesulfovibrio aespoeensis (strain ATCC 700646 / DSM 10631 / Aspo-2) TaxID=643562 RepID=E6VW50_PSEA9|nr:MULTISPECIES: RlmE family RNA methyltransferase [Pseudodesulfovibrio]MBU4191669.1 RlmE family RNA methyltransferase [Pseudomonadota bacterium]ADU63610.1 ribosomal RNA methyltransferase RrmJ/FtsJ [Pseudodesulfovibrio aespoeensis Aspo-2]MBU4243225.1 RlmE family RNA methyltransferase [Pseudomonadota bacterium]MBU4379965.1 RlmE family RNA methyltransferase [Pseudomonadota bacterium]MBU4475494.1 RlmE family RNA methyltransferase [Pseudomonadota bacterium]